MFSINAIKRIPFFLASVIIFSTIKLKDATLKVLFIS